jgi:7-carboxy-7-deazaguanine synthase
MNFDNFRYMRPHDEIKFVISSRKDYDWASDLVHTHGLNTLATVTFSPVTARLAPAELAAWILADRLPVRLRLQMHTLLWPEKTRGY